MPASYTWAVAIEGSENELLLSKRYFTDTADGKVAKLALNGQESRWLLVSNRFDDCADEREVRSEAQTILNAMNGLIFADNAMSTPIRLSGSIHKRAANGNWSAAIFLPTVQMSMGFNLGEPLTKPSLLNKVLAGSNALRSAVAYVANDPGWFEIYMAIESLAEIYGGEHELLKQSWTNGMRIKELKSEANAHRHANGSPAGMSLINAKREIAQIISRALASG
jgi:hypothetical protein